MRVRARTLALWIPTIALIVTAMVVALIVVTSNSNRISKLEQQNNPAVITFTFNQGAARFRIVCNEDKSSPNIYICATVRLGQPTPTPSPSRGG